MTRDHGGNIDWAQAHWGGDDWIDLSTGINRVPYPLPALVPEDWTGLPTCAAKGALIEAARAAYGTTAPLVALSGAQGAIQLLPRLLPNRTGREARVLSPTYNEHAAALRAAGWEVREVLSPEALDGADLAVIVNPNNPDGRRWRPGSVLSMATRVGRMIVDESFADPTPALSLAPHLTGAEGEPVVLRSFGKFYGLAGLRLGFAIGPAPVIAALAEAAGPWPVAGPALRVATQALQDGDWARKTAARLRRDAARADDLAGRAGWSLAGGTDLFRLYETPDATAARDRLARHRIWSRIFPWSPRWLRLGLPGSAAEWARLETALAG